MERDRQGGPAGRDPLAPLVLLAAGLFPLLAALRHLDDNSLASWAWVLEGRDAVGIWILQLGVVAAAALAAAHRVPRRAWIPALAAAGFLAGLAPALAGEPEGVIDAARYFTQAKYLELHGPRAFLGAWGAAVPAWTDLPLPGLFFGSLFRAFGEHRAVAQLATAGALALCVVATARAGELLGDAEAGARAGLLLLAAPALLLNTPLLMGDVLATSAVALALWGLLAAAEGRRAAVPLAALGVGAALLAKYSTWTLVAALAVAVLAREALRRRPRGAARALLAAAGGGLVLLAVLAPVRDVVARQLALLAGFQWEGLRRWSESYASTFLFQVHPLLAVAALAGLWRGIRRRDPGVLVLAAVPIVLLALGVRRSRYLLPALPMVALLAARGIDAVEGERRRRFLALWAVGFSLVTVLALQVPFLRWVNTANLAAAGRFLDASGVGEARVWVTPSPGVLMNPEVALPLLDYHTRVRLLAAGPSPEPPPPEQLRTSSLRFTWEDPLPDWYRGAPADGGRAAAVLVAGDPDGEPPAGLVAAVGLRPPDAVFARDAVFRYRALVSVWLPAR